MSYRTAGGVTTPARFLALPFDIKPFVESSVHLRSVNSNPRHPVQASV